MFTIKPSTFLFVFAACQLFATIVTCAPSPIPNPNPDTTNQISNAYSGPGGHASGGGPVTTDLSKSGLLLGLVGGDLLDVGSENGGKGGEANSGPAIPGSSHVTVAGAGSSTDPNGSASSSKDMSNAIGNSYSGTGGTADGGDVDTRLSAIKLFSSNGGDGGKANSGSSGRGLGSSLGLSSRGRRARVARFYKINFN